MFALIWVVVGLTSLVDTGKVQNESEALILLYPR